MCRESKFSLCACLGYDRYNVWPYLAGRQTSSPRSELPLAAPNNAPGKPQNPWSGTQVNVNGLIQQQGQATWKLLVGAIPQAQWSE